MTRIKKCVLLLLLLPFLVNAQTVQVKKEVARIEGKNTSGYQLDLPGGEEEVRSALSKYLKTIGKTKASSDYIMLAEPVIGGKPFGTAIYATTKQTGTTTTAWIGMESESGTESKRAAALEELAHDFGVAFHRDKIQLQIDESLRALQTVERQQYRLLNQNQDLNNRIERNKREKIALEQSLVGNKVELEDLVKKLDANGKAQDSIAVATEQIRKAVEMHRLRQQNVQ